MPASAVGLALVAEIAAMIGLVLSYDPNDYIVTKRTSIDSWYPKLSTALDTAGGMNLVTNPDYTKDMAILDTSNVIADMNSRFGAGTLSPTYQAQCTPNPYNSTAQATITSDANGRLGQSTAKVYLSSIAAYAQISQDRIAMYVELLKVGKGTQSVVTVSSAPYAASLTPVADNIITGINNYTADVASNYYNKSPVPANSKTFDPNFGD